MSFLSVARTQMSRFDLLVPIGTFSCVQLFHTTPIIPECTHIFSSQPSCPPPPPPPPPSKDPDGEQYNEQQEVTCTATGGTFTLTFRGFTTDAIAYDASAEDIADALQDLPSLYGSYDTATSIQFSASDTEVRHAIPPPPPIIYLLSLLARRKHVEPCMTLGTH